MDEKEPQGYDEQVRASLTEAGIPAAEINSILVGIPNSSNEEFVRKACLIGSPIKIVLAVAVVQTGKQRGRDSNLDLLLAYLNDHHLELEAEEQGIYWHLKGYTSWKWANESYTALRYLNLSLESLRKAATPNASLYLARVYDTLGQIAYSNGHLKEAEEDYEEALRIRETYDDVFGKALSYGNMGRLYLETGNFEAAYYFFHQDLQLIQKHFPERSRIQIQLISHLATCLLEQEKLEEAHSLYTQGQQMAEKEEDHVGQFFASVALGRIHVVKNELDKALEYRDKASAIANNHFSNQAQKEFSGIVDYLSAMSLSAEEKYPQALVLFERAIQVFDSFPSFSPVQRAQLLVHYAAAASALSEDGIASSLLLDALSYLDNTSAERLREEVEQKLKSKYKQAWLQHSIQRFTGIKKGEFLLEQAGQSGFQGAHQHIAILVSDIRQFTGISEDLDPGDLIQFINEYFNRMIRCVDQYEGYVDKIIGDAIMAIFTIPVPRTDDAERAVYAGLMMQEALKKFNDRLPDGIKALNVGIGIHFGKVVAGLIGSPAKRSYTILGDTVNTAFRLEGMTKELGVSLLVTDQLLEKLPDTTKFLLRPLGRFLPRGRKDYIAVYELIGEKASRPDAGLVALEIEQATKSLALFYDQQFEQAAPAFEALFIATKIKAYRLLQEKAIGFSAEPPERDWEGVVVLGEK